MDESVFITYDINMRTPIGIRRGEMKVSRHSDKIDGYLDILNHNEPFEGNIDDDGNCEISGKIITLMRTINFAATGRITRDGVTLSISDGRHVLEITGIPAAQKGSLGE